MKTIFEWAWDLSYAARFYDWVMIDGAKLVIQEMAAALLVLSVIGLLVSIKALPSAYKELRDTKQEFHSAESDCIAATDPIEVERICELTDFLGDLLYQTKRLYWAHWCLFCFHILMVTYSQVALFLPPVADPYAQVRALLLTGFLLSVKPFTLSLQIFLWQMTNKQRLSREDLGRSDAKVAPPNLKEGDIQS